MNNESGTGPFAGLEDPIDRTILKELQRSRSAPADIGDNTRLAQEYVERRLNRLEADGYVESDDHGVYGVTPDLREAASL